MEQNYLISVIIPVHNTGKYLKKCIDSVINQSLERIEIILVENASTDGSAQICDEYAILDSRIRVLHIPIPDLSRARNEGLAIASAPYIGFVDSDDHIGSEMYKILLDTLIECQADVSMCNYSLEFAEDGHVVSGANTGNVVVYTGVEAARSILKGELSNASWDKLYRRELFDTLRFPEGVFYEDHFTMVDWFSRCSCVAHIDISYYYYLQRQDSICRDFNPIKGYHFFLADFQRWEFVNRNELLNSFERKEFVNKIVYRCYFNFKKVLSVVKPKYFKKEVEDMRNKQLAYLRKEKGVLNFKNNIRLLKVTYLWLIYYWVSFGFKKRVWKRG